MIGGRCGGLCGRGLRRERSSNVGYAENTVGLWLGAAMRVGIWGAIGREVVADCEVIRNNF